jgi:YegS/Rv2252/BmrU family lipid kinase
MESQSMTASRRAMLILNPEARRQPKREHFDQGIDWLQQHDWNIEHRSARQRGDVETIAREAAEEGFDCVVACGGDGTIHEALNGVVGSRTALAVVPSGTVNIWAYEARLPSDPLAALRLLEEGDRVCLDTGRAGDRAFLLMASVGLDSLVAGQVSSRLKRRFGMLPYLGRAALDLRTFDGFEAEITLDGERIQTELVAFVAGNTRSYGRVLSITPNARADDGLLDVCIFTGSGRLRFLRSLVQTAARLHLQNSDVIYYQARSIELRTGVRWPVQLDGEVVARTPLRIECLPQSVQVIVPQGIRTPLWDNNRVATVRGGDCSSQQSDQNERGGAQ